MTCVTIGTTTIGPTEISWLRSCFHISYFVVALLGMMGEKSGWTKHVEQSLGFVYQVLIGFSLTVKAATLILISGRGSAISSAKQGKSGSIFNLVKN